MFLFATRLTRVTREIASRGADQAVTLVVKRIADWGGGTRIGDAIRTFNVDWARRVGGHGPIVLLISDGWDRGEPERLAHEMARLARSCYRLIWLNPLLGSPGYQPVTRGMAAALPFVDDFLPVHNMVSLEALAAHLNTLSSRRVSPTATSDRRARASRFDAARGRALRSRFGLRLETGEEAVHHHLRDRAEQPLPDARHQSADLTLAVHVDRGRARFVDELDPCFAFDESRLAGSFDDEAVGLRRLLVDDRHRAGVLTADGGDGEREVGLEPIVAERLQAVTSGQARGNDVGIVEQGPDPRCGRRERVGAGQIHLCCIVA